MGELSSCYSLKKRKARKQHKCCECKGVIQAGEVYNLHSGIWNCEPASFKVCADCEELRDRIRSECDLSPDEAPALSNMRYDLRDYDEETGYLSAFLAICEKRAEKKLSSPEKV